MGPGIFFKTWLLYTAVILIGLGILNLFITSIPPINKRYQNPVKRFFLFFNFSCLFGTVGLIALVKGDLETGYQEFGLFLLFTGVVTTFFSRRIIKRAPKIPEIAILISLILFVLTSGTYWASNLHFSSAVRHQSSDFSGQIKNVCLLVMDTARGDHFSCNGYSFITTPNIDRIAEEGLLYTKAFSASNWTPPGHISIFTGKYPSQHGNNGKAYMPDELVSLTEILHQEGYYCMAMYNNPLAGGNINLTQGFDNDIGVFGSHWVYPAPFRLWDKFVKRDSGSKITFSMAQATFEWMKKRGAHLFLYINVTEPHAPYNVHEPYFSDFTQFLNKDKIGNIEQTKELCRTLDLIIHDSTRFVGSNEESYRYIRATYDSEMAYCDHYFGKFADWMDAAGLLNETLLVITADHGEFLGEHLTMGHPELLFNPVLRIPLILRYPRLIKPKVDDGYASNVDVFPTVLNLMGLEDRIPENVSGMNLLEDQSRDKRPLLSANINSGGGVYSLIDGSYKLIVNADEFLPKYFAQDTLLFDLDNDPNELFNLHISKIEILGNLAFQLDDWIDHITVAPQSTIEVSDATIANLKALGYVH